MKMTNMDAKKTILIVEDDEFILKVYEQQFRSKNYNTVVVRDGQEALDKLPEINPDVIMLDLIIPTKNGFEVLEEIKKQPKFASIPVIVLSNLRQESDVEQVKALGAVDYLVKANMRIDEVVAAVEKQLGV